MTKKFTALDDSSDDDFTAGAREGADAGVDGTDDLQLD
jgi:hypothetical protein